MKLEILIPDGLVEDARKLATRRKLSLSRWATELIENNIAELRVRYLFEGWTEDKALDATEKKG